MCVRLCACAYVCVRVQCSPWSFLLLATPADTMLCFCAPCRGVRSMQVSNVLKVLPREEVQFYIYWAALEHSPFPEVCGGRLVHLVVRL